jgi:hypothetical protein
MTYKGNEGTAWLGCSRGFNSPALTNINHKAMIIDFEGLSLDELCDGVHVDAQVRIEENTEGADYMRNTYTSTYVDGDIYIVTAHGKYKAEGRFGEYLESLIIAKAEKQV